MITLAQSKEGRADKVEQMVIEMFIKKSEVLELLPFANDVSPNGGSTLTYGYVQEKTPSMAAFRAIGSEYTANEATVEKKTVSLAVFGGSFEIDRIIKTIEGQLNNMAFQLEEKVAAAVGLFHDTMINGDTTQTAYTNGFDGLDKMLVGTTNEFNTSSYIDLSNMTNLKANMDSFYEALQNLINKSSADAVLVNEDMKTKIQTVARLLGYKTESEEAFGRTITKIGEVRIIDLGNTYSVNGTTVTKNPVIAKNHGRSVGTGLGTYTLTSDTALNAAKTYYTRSGQEGSYTYTKVTSPDVSAIATYYEQDGVYVTGLTDIYGVKFDVNNGFCGVSITGNDVVQQYLPDFSQPGALKKGEVEMVACVALKNANNAGVLRNIKIA